MSEPVEVTLSINGRDYPLRLEPRRTLLDAIRDECGLTGTHMGCEHGVCGACTVLLEGQPIRACLMFAVQAEGAAIRTIEFKGGIDAFLKATPDGKLSPEIRRLKKRITTAEARRAG